MFSNFYECAADWERKLMVHYVQGLILSFGHWRNNNCSLVSHLQTANIHAETLYDIDDSTYDVDESNALVPLIREKHQVEAPKSHTHVELIDVKCDAKNGMLVSIEFEEAFSGIIYSQGYFNDPKCRWVIFLLNFVIFFVCFDPVKFIIN